MTPRPRTFPVVLAGFTAFLDLYATQPLLPLLERVFHATPAGVSLTITGPTIAVALAAPAAGRLGDRFGRKPVIVGSAVALTIATMLAATAPTLRALVAWRFLQGLATPGIFAAIIAHVHDAWDPARTAAATSAYVSGTVVGGFCGRALMALVTASAGWPAAFLVLGAVNLVATVALWVWLPADRRPHAHPSAPPRGSLVPHLRNARLQATYAVGFFVLFGQIAVFTYVTFLLADPPFSLSTAALGWIFAVYLVGAMITPIAGRWIDVHGHRAGIAVAMGVGAIGALLTLGATTGVVVTGLGLVATGVFVAQATASSHIGAVTTSDRGLAVGLYSTFYYLGGSLGGTVPAFLWAAGGWPACVALVLAVQAVTAWIAFRYWTPGARLRRIGIG
jgi:MFS transporter, YNFM family, putative membrane transport protein